MKNQMSIPVQKGLSSSESAKHIIREGARQFHFNIEGACFRNVMFSAAAILSLLAGQNIVGVLLLLALVLFQVRDFLTNLFHFNMDFELGKDISKEIMTDLISSERA